MSLYGDLPPPTHTSEKEETTEQQSTLETTLQNDKTTTKPSKKPALPAKQATTSDVYNEYKTVSNIMRNQRKGTKKQLPPPLSLDDDYDPTRPNDYEEYKEMEKKSKENETVHHRQDNFKKRQRSISPSSDHRRRSSPSFLRRAKLSNSAAVVNESASKSPEIKPTNTSGSGEHFAHRLLAKYGWQEGQGLGKNEQGINVPLMVKKTDVRSGIIINNSSNINNPVQVGNELIQKAIQNIETPSRVILLRNMVGPGQVDDTLQEETADECNEKYGTVERCLIFEVPNGKLPDNQAVRIFVKFVDIEAAIKAKKDLNGRFFGGRSVSAKYFDEARFDKLDLAPTPAELDNW
ncbi:21680_t:CDS:2 [Entrophospora sp. SA101]|nr:5881_t:CDS:2 [Entrophospora sp. SA101]CAJ0755356.1 21680_t:CDS:2 [Entrophospora sp. SA101]